MAVETTLSPALVSALTPYLVDGALAVFTVALGFVGRAVHGFINAHKNDKNFAFLMNVATMAVQAAEQQFGSDGEAKLAWATKYVQAELDRRNIRIDVDQVRAQIEAAVMSEFNYPAAVTPADAPAETTVVSEAGEKPETVVETPITEDGFDGVDNSEDVV